MLGFCEFLKIVVKPTSKNYLLGFIMMLKMVRMMIMHMGG